MTMKLQLVSLRQNRPPLVEFFTSDYFATESVLGAENPTLLYMSGLETRHGDKALLKLSESIPLFHVKKIHNVSKTSKQEMNEYFSDTEADDTFRNNSFVIPNNASLVEASTVNVELIESNKKTKNQNAVHRNSTIRDQMRFT